MKATKPSPTSDRRDLRQCSADAHEESTGTTAVESSTAVSEASICGAGPFCSSRIHHAQQVHRSVAWSLRAVLQVIELRKNVLLLLEIKLKFCDNR